MQKIKRTLYDRKTLLLRLAVVILTMIFTVGLLSQAAFARTTYVITDGDKVVIHTTYATDPAAVLTEVGLTLGDEDTFTAQPGQDVSEITVNRLQLVHVYDGEQVLEVATYGATVSDILAQLRITVTGDMRISQPMDEKTTDGMVIRVTYLRYETEEYTIPAPFETHYCIDETLAPDEEVVLIEGVEGVILCTDSVGYLDGAEVSRARMEEQVLVQPINRVVVTGIDRSTKAQEGADRVYVPILDSLGFNSTESPGSGGAIVSDNGSSITTASGEVIPYTRRLAVEATAYCKQGATAVGTPARYGAIAVDPSVIPYGTEMYIVSSDGQYIYGFATAEDCGNFRGYSIDLFFDEEDACWKFGRRRCIVYILG